MPTLGTGTSESAIARCRLAQRGFTLLELLVVVAIIALLAGAVTLSMGALGSDRDIDQETNRLRSLLDLLHEESLMQSRDYGIMFTRKGYRFFVYDYRQLTWVEPTTDRLLAPHALDPQLEMVLVLDGREVPLERDLETLDVDARAPQIMLLASGEVTPFTLEMRRGGAAGHFELAAQLDGTVNVTEEGFD